VRHTPQQNGLSECNNRSIPDKTRASLHAAALGTDFWAEAVLDTVDKLNHLPAAATGRVPHAEIYDTKPSAATFLAFGQHGYVLDTEGIKHKLKDRSRPARYLSRKGESIYRIYYIDTNTFGTARAADFRPYNPNKDPVFMAPVAVLALPLSMEAPSEALTTAEIGPLASVATSVATINPRAGPLSDVDRVPVLPAEITKRA
jgi:hypothetical protein